MSQENVEIVRRSIDAFDRGDRDEALADFARKRSGIPPVRFADRRVYRGPAGIGHLWGELQEDFEELRLTVTDIRAVGEDRVFVAVVGAGRGKRSRARLEAPLWFVDTLHDRLIVRVEPTLTRQKPSKPPGLRSRRCRRRTWSLSVGPWRSLPLPHRRRGRRPRRAGCSRHRVRLLGSLSGRANHSRASGLARLCGLVAMGSVLKFEPERFIDVDGERVLVLMHVTAEGRAAAFRLRGGPHTSTPFRTALSPASRVLGPVRRPRSRRARGVGDVAGERRTGLPIHRRFQPPRSRFLPCALRHRR